MDRQVFQLVSPLVRRNAAHAIANAPEGRIGTFISLAGQGLMGKDIAARMGISATTVSEWSKKFGVAITDGRKPPKVDLTQAFLKSVLSYSPETGGFIRTDGRGAGRPAVPKQNGYLYISIQGVEYLAHRLAWIYVYGKWPDNQIDHINGIRTDNRIRNLRDVPNRINTHNRNDAPKASSGIRGVSYDERRGKYRARLTSMGREVWLGYHDSADLAHVAYEEAKKRMHEGYVG